MMTRINLLSEERKKKQKRAKKVDLPKVDIQSLPILNYIYLVFGILALIQIGLLLINFYSSGTFSNLDKHYKEILPKKTEADALKVEADVMSKKVASIDQLMVTRFSWARKLNDLSDAIIPAIWLTELYYDERVIEVPALPGAVPRDPKIKGKGLSGKPVMEKKISKYLIMTGYSLNSGGEGTAIVGRFIKNLKDSQGFFSEFSEIELGAIKREKVEDQEVMNFKITCLYK